MFRSNKNTVSALLLTMGILVGTVLGQEPDTQQREGEPSVEKLGEGLYKIGSVILDSNRDEIYVKGEVNMQRGGIEYLACTRRGKLHESVFVLDVKPYEFQVALLLMGLEPKGGLEYQGDPSSPQGDSVEIWVEWEVNGKKERHRGEDLVFNIPTKRPMTQTPWVFTGSKIVKGTFMANVEQSLIATYNDPFAIINNPLPTGADDTVYRVNENIVPERGTPITVIIKPIRSDNKN